MEGQGTPQFLDWNTSLKSINPKKSITAHFYKLLISSNLDIGYIKSIMPTSKSLPTQKFFLIKTKYFYLYMAISLL